MVAVDTVGFGTPITPRPVPNVATRPDHGDDRSDHYHHHDDDYFAPVRPYITWLVIP